MGEGVNVSVGVGVFVRVNVEMGVNVGLAVCVDVAVGVLVGVGDWKKDFTLEKTANRMAAMIPMPMMEERYPL